jgi:hypothetical protein
MQDDLAEGHNSMCNTVNIEAINSHLTCCERFIGCKDIRDQCTRLHWCITWTIQCYTVHVLLGSAHRQLEDAAPSSSSSSHKGGQLHLERQHQQRSSDQQHCKQGPACYARAQCCYKPAVHSSEVGCDCQCHYCLSAGNSLYAQCCCANGCASETRQ